MALDAETARTIVGIIGNVISFFLFISPAPTFYKIFKAKSVQNFKPDPYVVTVLNCSMWVFYGMPFVHPDSILVLTINAIGLFVELVFVTLFVIYSPDWPKRSKILIAMLVEFVFLAVVVLITLFCLHGSKARSMLVGIVSIVFNIAMYTSPLTIMKRVITTKSVKFMPFYLSLANFANGTVWFFYALIKFDPYVLVPNALGCLSGLVQLILYATYYKSTNSNEQENTARQTETEIQPDSRV
ncbi:bidirectional sugar transporter SWEET5 [Striga asiatica]|uniref:Bidirectional sugar transporter SWEET n=1 Tax=Striga asiatica TaxID=4170 RepID=A0A5A7Q086_STRAF|nr:bidirectional sugar transporter SWEET5 [Striga asiatica]